MGSTILLGKKAAAFRRPDTGKVVYALFEQTCETNCRPQTPDWSCIALGEYSDVMRHVFLGASCCEGGSLKSRAGHIKPENYIEAWKRELKAPVALSDVTIRLSVKDSIYATIPADALDVVRDVLGKAGYSHECAQIEADGGDFSLHRDIGLLLVIFGVRAPLSPWHIIEHHNFYGEADESLAPEMAKGLIEPPAVVAFRVDDDSRLVKIGDGPLLHAGWEYLAVGNYITGVAYDLEMRQTGSAKKQIIAFRETLRNAPEVPLGTMVMVKRDTNGDAADYHRSNADQLARKAGVWNGEAGNPPPESFGCAFGMLEPEAQRALQYLAKDQVEWVLPEQQESFVRKTGAYF